MVVSVVYPRDCIAAQELWLLATDQHLERIDQFDLLLSKGLSRVFSRTTIPKHPFFSAEPSLLSNSHIHIRLLEKP